MARTIETTIVCDGPGCRKQPGKVADFISVRVEHQLADADTPEGVANPLLLAETYDFCSYEHLAAWAGEFGEEFASKRDELIEERVPNPVAENTHPVEGSGPHIPVSEPPPAHLKMEES